MPKVSFTRVPDIGYAYKFAVGIDGKPIGVIAVNWVTDSAPTGVCGTYIYRDFKITTWIQDGAGHKLDTMNTFLGEIKKAGAWNAVSKFLIKSVVDILTKSNYNAMFGGRVNIIKDEWEACFGVYSCGIANYVKENNLGTITSSHLYVNPVHKTLTDFGNFAIHQTFIWTKPTWYVIEDNSVGVQINESNINTFNAMVEEQKRYGVLNDPKARITPAYKYEVTKEELPIDIAVNS
jgi:hypothetical protein